MRPTAPTPVLTIDERQQIEAGPWFSKLSPALRFDILARASVRRFDDGAALSVRGQPPQDWCGVERGAVRVSSTTLAGRQITLTYVEPGTWFGDIALLDGLPRTHDATAHGATTVLAVHKSDFRDLMRRHVELMEALLQLNARRLRLMFDQLEDLYTLPLAARLAKQVLQLARGYGVEHGGETVIGLPLAQEELAQLLGASRQRVNQELKAMERAGALRVEPPRLVICSLPTLQRMAQG